MFYRFVARICYPIAKSFCKDSNNWCIICLPDLVAYVLICGQMNVVTLHASGSVQLEYSNRPYYMHSKPNYHLVVSDAFCLE